MVVWIEVGAAPSTSMMWKMMDSARTASIDSNDWCRGCMPSGVDVLSLNFLDILMMASGSEGDDTGIDHKEDPEGSPAGESCAAHAVDKCWNSLCIRFGRDEERPPGHLTTSSGR